MFNLMLLAETPLDHNAWLAIIALAVGIILLSTLMLHHLPGKLRAECAGEIRRVLKPGGRVLAVDFGTSPAQRGIVAHFHRHGHVSLAEIIAIFNETGLSIVDSGAVGISDLQYLLAAAPCCE